jgi:hypothetical protein
MLARAHEAIHPKYVRIEDAHFFQLPTTTTSTQHLSFITNYQEQHAFVATTTVPPKDTTTAITIIC